VAPFAAATIDDFAAISRFHAGPKSVDFLTTSFASLVGSFHELFPKNGFRRGL
jgi:hypothetical protein